MIASFSLKRSIWGSSRRCVQAGSGARPSTIQGRVGQGDRDAAVCLPERYFDDSAGAARCFAEAVYAMAKSVKMVRPAMKHFHALPARPRRRFDMIGSRERPATTVGEKP